MADPEITEDDIDEVEKDCPICKSTFSVLVIGVVTDHTMIPCEACWNTFEDDWMDVVVMDYQYGFTM